jgi:signal transduction histidine kinase
VVGPSPRTPNIAHRRWHRGVGFARAGAAGSFGARHGARGASAWPAIGGAFETARRRDQRLANALAYEQERARAEALADIDRAKTACFSNVSHAFRTPLTLR